MKWTRLILFVDINNWSLFFLQCIYDNLVLNYYLKVLGKKGLSQKVLNDFIGLQRLWFNYVSADNCRDRSYIFLWDNRKNILNPKYV